VSHAPPSARSGRGSEGATMPKRSARCGNAAGPTSQIARRPPAAPVADPAIGVRSYVLPTRIGGDAPSASRCDDVAALATTKNTMDTKTFREKGAG
jgi:hypothetical protein